MTRTLPLLPASPPPQALAADILDLLRQALGGLVPADAGLSHVLDRMERAE